MYKKHNYKHIKNIPLAVIISLMYMITGCKKDSNNEFEKLPLTNIHKDPIFKDYIIKTQEQYNLVKDFTLLQKIMLDGKISKTEDETIHSVYGYKNKEEFRSAVKNLSNIKSYLLNKYNFQLYSKSDKKEAILKTLVQINEFKPLQLTNQVSLKAYSSEISSKFIADDCEKIRRNCILSVAAEATIMHLGCAALDVTILLGIACHSAATLYQYTAGENCNLEAKKCNN